MVRAEDQGSIVQAMDKRAIEGATDDARERATERATDGSDCSISSDVWCEQWIREQ